MKNQKKTSLSVDEAEKLISGNPRELIRKAEEAGIDFSDLKFDVKKKLIQDGYGLSDKDLEAVDFVYWISYFIERSAEELIIDPQVEKGAQRETMEVLVAEMSFGSKITVIEKLYLKKGDVLVKMMRKIQILRNSVAHGRFDELVYKGYHLDKGNGQILLVGDVRDAYLKSKDN